MTKEELGKLIDSKKFSKTMRSFGDDKLRNFIEEIYYDGMRAGYNYAKYTLELVDRMPFGAADKYLDNNMEKIRSILKLCEQYENGENTEWLYGAALSYGNSWTKQHKII